MIYITWMPEKLTTERKYKLSFCATLQFKFNYKTQNMILVSNDQRYFLGAKGTKVGLNILFASLEKIVTFVRFISFTFKG